MSAVITIYSILAVALAASLFKDRKKTRKAFKVALRALMKNAPNILAIVGIIGLILGIFTPETIARLVGEEAGFTATLLAGLIGAVTIIPSLISFPLAGTLIENGATVTTAAAFITSLVMVGFVTMPLEVKALGKKFAVIRNGFGLIAAFVIAIIMGVILG
ncbi:MAG: permease [Bacillota bacterium]